MSHASTEGQLLDFDIGSSICLGLVCPAVQCPRRGRSGLTPRKKKEPTAVRQWALCARKGYSALVILLAALAAALLVLIVGAGLLAALAPLLGTLFLLLAGLLAPVLLILLT